MTIEIVGFPIKNGGSFHGYVNVYQRVTPVINGISRLNPQKSLDYNPLTLGYITMVMVEVYGYGLKQKMFPRWLSGPLTNEKWLDGG